MMACSIVGFVGVEEVGAGMFVTNAGQGYTQQLLCCANVKKV